MLLARDAARGERILAVCRVCLAVFCLLAVSLHPTAVLYPRAYRLVLTYLAFSLLVLLLLQGAQRLRWELPAALHGVDVLWCAAIALAAGGSLSSLFPLLFFFFVLAAGYRWGLWETVATAGLGAAVLFISARDENLAVSFRSALSLRAGSLLLLGVLLGWIANDQRRLRRQVSTTAQILVRAQAETGFRGMLSAVSDDVLAHFAARQALLALRETHTQRVYLWEAGPADEQAGTSPQLSELDSGRQATYLFDFPAAAWYTIRRDRGRRPPFHNVALGSQDDRRRCQSALPEDFLAGHPFQTALAVSFTSDEWSGRLFVLDPRRGRPRMTQLMFLQTLVRQVSPALQNVYQARRLRARAGAAERARVARELHDGLIQSLIGLEMKVDVLRRKASQSGQEASELADIQFHLRQEVINLRELMEQMKPLDLRPQQLLDFLAESVDKFQRETGISANFVSELDEVRLPARTCREVARIVQEGLVNARKHSHAQNVVVRFGQDKGNWKVVIDDDGRGFGFSGRLSPIELDASRKGPVVIKERVRSIGGALAIESYPNRGARLEITVPQKTHG